MAPGRKKLSQECFEKKAKKRNPWVEVISQYSGSDSPVTVRCKCCGKEWSVRGRVLLHRDVRCKGCRLSEDAKWFAAAMERENRDIRIIGAYSGLTAPVRAECTACGNIWERKPYYFLGHPECPECRKKRHKQERGQRHAMRAAARVHADGNTGSNAAVAGNTEDVGRDAEEGGRL